MPRILTQSFSKIECTYNVFFIHNASQSHNMNCAIWLITSMFALIHSISPSTSTLAGPRTPRCFGEKADARVPVHVPARHEGLCTRTRGSVRAPACRRGCAASGGRTSPAVPRAAHPPDADPAPHKRGHWRRELLLIFFFFFLMYHNEQETYVMKYFQRSIFNYHLQSTQL